MIPRLTRAGEVTVVEVGGELTAANRESLRERLLERLQEGDRKFVLDFSDTSYIDSSGLGVLVSLSREIRMRGAELRLAGLNDDLRTVFELTRLDTLFRICETRAAAIGEL